MPAIGDIVEVSDCLPDSAGSAWAAPTGHAALAGARDFAGRRLQGRVVGAVTSK